MQFTVSQWTRHSLARREFQFDAKVGMELDQFDLLERRLGLYEFSGKWFWEFLRALNCFYYAASWSSNVPWFRKQSKRPATAWTERWLHSGNFPFRFRSPVPVSVASRKVNVFWSRSKGMKTTNRVRRLFSFPVSVRPLIGNVYRLQLSSLGKRQRSRNPLVC